MNVLNRKVHDYTWHETGGVVRCICLLYFLPASNNDTKCSLLLFKTIVYKLTDDTYCSEYINIVNNKVDNMQATYNK